MPMALQTDYAQAGSSVKTEQCICDVATGSQVGAVAERLCSAAAEQL